MKRPTLVSLLIALALLGLADAWYLADSAMTGAQLTCNIAGLDGCNIVAQSPYSHVFGIPLGVYGVVFYTLFLVVSVFTFWRPLRIVDVAIGLLASVGFAASIYFVYIQVFLIKALCIYCLGSAAISLLIWLSVGWLIYGLKSQIEAPVLTMVPSSSS